MTVEAFEDAVRRGLGRAVLCLDREDPAPFADSIVAACLECVQYDPQCEAERAPYLMELVERAGLGERVRDAILSRLPDMEEGRSRRQMLRILREYARKGDETAWGVLIDAARQGDESAQDYLAELGQRGIAWLVENILPVLPADDSYRPCSWLDDAEEAGDVEPALLAILREKQKAWERELKQRPTVDRRPPSMRELLDRAAFQKSPLTSFALAAKEASREELIEVAERLLVETNPHQARQYALVFRRQRFPLPDSRLIDRARSEPFRPMFLDLLGRLNTVEVHRYALELLRERPIPSGALGALVASFAQEDIGAIEAVLPLMEQMGEDDRHSFVLDLLTIAKKVPPDDRPTFLRWIYEHSPCSFCRMSAVPDLDAIGALTPEIREEAVWDAEPETRAAVRPSG